MAMPLLPETRRYTVAEALALPDDGNRYEVVHGELLVTPAPGTPHQAAVIQLAGALFNYLTPLGLAQTLFLGPADIFWGDDVWVQPDLLVVLPEQVTRDWHTYKNLRLTVEVLSPSSARGDRIVKRRAYQENHVGTYWIVDPDKNVVEVWRPGDEAPELLTDILQWQVTPEAPVLEIDLMKVWAAIPR